MIPSLQNIQLSYSNLIIGEYSFQLDEFSINETQTPQSPFSLGSGLPHFRPPRIETTFEFTIRGNSDFLDNISTIGEDCYIINSNYTQIYVLMGMSIHNINKTYDYESATIITEFNASLYNTAYYTDADFDQINNDQIRNKLKQKLRLKKLNRIIDDD